MKVFVYGTLKAGYNNNRRLDGATYLGNDIVKGYKLFNSGFPVAAAADDCSVLGEVYQIEEDIHLKGLDQLEGFRGVGEHNMYERYEAITEGGHEVHMYVGEDKRWHFEGMRECPNENNVYSWNR